MLDALPPFILQIFKIFSGLLVFTIVVFFHELGHFLLAKWQKIPVEAFSIGMGQAIWKKKYGETTYMIAWIPIGGYVQFSGDESTSSSEGLNAFAWWRRILVALAGPGANFITAFFALLFLFLVWGRIFPQASIGEIVADSPAAKAGLMVGDRILEVEGQPVAHFQAMVNLVEKRPGQATVLTIQRPSPNKLEGAEGAKQASNTVKLVVVPEEMEQLNPEDLSQKQKVGKLGIRPGNEMLNELLDTPQAFAEAWQETLKMIKMTFSTLLGLLNGNVKVSQLAGPIGIMKVSGNAAAAGWAAFLKFIAFLSVNLAVINLLPLPVLDGGQALIALAEGIIRRQIKPEAVALFQKASFVLLIGLMIYASFNDLVHIFIK